MCWYLRHNVHCIFFMNHLIWYYLLSISQFYWVKWGHIKKCRPVCSGIASGRVHIFYSILRHPVASSPVSLTPSHPIIFLTLSHPFCPIPSRPMPSIQPHLIFFSYSHIFLVPSVPSSSHPILCHPSYPISSFSPLHLVPYVPSHPIPSYPMPSILPHLIFFPAASRPICPIPSRDIFRLYYPLYKASLWNMHESIDLLSCNQRISSGNSRLLIIYTTHYIYNTLYIIHYHNIIFVAQFSGFIARAFITTAIIIVILYDSDNNNSKRHNSVVWCQDAPNGVDRLQPNGSKARNTSKQYILQQ